MSKPAQTLEEQLATAQAELATSQAENASLKESIEATTKAEDKPEDKADDTPPKADDTPDTKADDAPPAPKAETPDGLKALEAKIDGLQATVDANSAAIAKQSIDTHAADGEDTPHNVSGSDNGKDADKPQLSGIEATEAAFSADVKGLGLRTD